MTTFPPTNSATRPSRRSGWCRWLALFTWVVLSPVLIEDLQAQDQSTTVTIRGVVVDAETRQPLRGVSVSLGERGVRLFTDEAGRFEVTDISIGTYRMSLQMAGYLEAAGDLHILRDGEFVTALTPMTAGSPSAADPARLAGTVTDQETGRPLAGAEVSIPELFLSALTDADGRFGFQTVPSGEHLVEFSYLGYATRAEAITAVPGRVANARVALSIDPLDIEPIEVVVEARQIELEDVGFYQRREEGFGEFIDRETIERKSMGRMTDLFQGVAGVQVIQDQCNPLMEYVVLRSGRGGRTSSGGNMDCYGNRCFPMVIMDGLVIHRGGTEPFRVDDMLDPVAVAGVEVFPSQSGVPAQYSGVDASCGVIMFWTRR